MAKQTKILVNALLLDGQFSGVTNSIEKILVALGQVASAEKDLAVSVLLGTGYSGSVRSDGLLSIVETGIKATNRVARIAFEHLRIQGVFRKHGYDLYHGPTYILPFLKPGPSIVTVHDLISLDYPALCQKESAWYFRFALPRSILTADRIVVVSQAVKMDVLRHFPSVESQKIKVIHHGIDAAYARVTCVNALFAAKHKYNLPDKYLLFTGNIEPKKNLPRLLQAFSELKNHYQVPHKLVIAGRPAWGYTPFLGQLRQLRLESEVIQLGFVPEKDLPVLYSLADVFVFPSLYEGFGLPVLEAMACGTPTVVSNRGALPEVTGGNCHQVDPESIRDMVSVLHTVISDEPLREKHSINGVQWASRFRWRSSAEQLLQQYITLARA
jgi:glycosyltransferase involved in cell wall biosynthesis